MQFTGAVLTQTGKPLALVSNIQVPRLGRGQVLVKIIYTGICHSQLMEVQGKRGEDRWLPHFLGHEATAIVIDTGQDVRKVSAGDKVVLGWLKGKGIDAPGAKYNSPIGTINSGGVTTFSEYSVVSENRCYLLPDSLNMQTGVLFGCALPTGMGMVQNQLPYTPDSRIGVFGLGGIGMSALMAILQNAPQQVVVFDINNDKLALARKMGASVAINSGDTDWLQQLDEYTQQHKLDYIIECAGSCRTIEMAFSALNRRGKCVFASHPDHGYKICIDPFELISGKTIEGSWGGKANPETLLNEQAGQTDNELLIKLMSSPYQLENINQAMQDLADSKVVRAMVKVADIR
ncbi:zinc-binding dehydrogenase [Aestuariibacter sp. A3R04]|uniref:zinc-binding dehydrogenase n=1 Tax=Aestuariibacter sp. A3R04 TaxID=2841571 RepID=UPI001C0A016C|nr:zinc-binding dehydrogenase [Aestuariibacter sp. A3R04]MBU3022201.1 zinc-binding dehydrogenase [Aestuariibacter sp. A3R04]